MLAEPSIPITVVWPLELVRTWKEDGGGIGRLPIVSGQAPSLAVDIEADADVDVGVDVMPVL